MKSTFLPKRAKKALAEGRSPPQDRASERSELYLQVIITWIYFLTKLMTPKGIILNRDHLQSYHKYFCSNNWIKTSYTCIYYIDFAKWAGTFRGIFRWLGDCLFSPGSLLPPSLRNSCQILDLLQTWKMAFSLQSTVR